jgi:hypothetical protein
MTTLRSLLTRSAVVSAALILLGCQTVPDQSGNYKFEIAGATAKTDSGAALTLRFVHADESLVQGAQLFVVRWVPTGQKNSPVRQQLTALPSDAKGNFIYTSDGLHAGEKLALAARLQPDGPLIQGSVEVR